MNATLLALSSTGMTPIYEDAREERDENVRMEAAQYIKNNDIDKTAIIEMLAKTDPIINHVWTYYTVNKQTSPINPADVKYFWEKVSECFADIGEVQVKKINNINHTLET